MTLTQQLQFISDTFADDTDGLPPLLTGAGLEDFAEYLPRREFRSDDLELCVYPNYVKNTTDRLETSFIVKAQLYKLSNAESSQYYDIIEPFIRENIKAEDLGFTDRMSVDADFFPADLQSTSYIFFILVFSSDLDDCEV